jgi:hypothetical protein
MKSRVVAIAKDEGAYLADWVFHHRYFGFDEVHVCLNRTTDHSVAVLDRIRRYDPAVTYEHIDWVDMCPKGVVERIQHIAYAKALDKARSEGVDWLMFLDVDEFWMPADFQTTVPEYLDRLFADRPPGAVCHLWHNEHGSSMPFSPLANKGSFTLAPNVKTLFPLRQGVKKIRIHCPELHESIPIYDTNAESMAFHENTQRAARHMLGANQVFVMHRMYRSEPEYLASVLRGNPEQDDYGMKRNRKGYLGGSDGRAYSFPPKSHADYLKERACFLSDAGLELLVAAERDWVLKRATVARQRLKTMLAQEDDPTARDLAIQLVKGLTGF